MNEYDLSRLEELLTDWIVELDDTRRPTLAHNARLVKESVEYRIEELKTNA